jgi:hypothetical protein
MMKKTMVLLISLICINTFFADNSANRTQMLHYEAISHKNPNITEKTHPVLYAMIQRLAAAADVAMPRYITLHGAECAVVDQNGIVRRASNDITAWTDGLGDMHICYELLTDLSYEEIEGIVAIALAEKKEHKPVKLLTVGALTFGATVALVCCLNHEYGLHLGSFLFSETNNPNPEDLLKAFLCGMVIPALVATKLASNNLQKKIDFTAAQLAPISHVIDGIRARLRLERSYFKEGLLSRIAAALHLRSIYNILFYPVRAFTDEERIDYLQNK